MLATQRSKESFTLVEKGASKQAVTRPSPEQQVNGAYSRDRPQHSALSAIKCIHEQPPNRQRQHLFVGQWLRALSPPR